MNASWPFGHLQTFLAFPVGVSRKLRPQTRKNQPLGCLENSDPKNSDPLGISKTQTRKIKHIYTAQMPQADLFTVRRYSGIIPKSAEKRKTVHSVRYVQ